MFDKLKFKFAEATRNLKRSIENNKYFYLVALVAVVIGIITALTSTCGNEFDSNIITKISDGEFGYLFFFIKIAFFTAAVYFLSWLLSFNFIVFAVGNFAIILFFTKYIIGLAIAAVLASVSGLILLIFLYLPLYIVNLLVFCRYLIILSEFTRTCCKKITQIAPLRLSACGVLRTIKSFLWKILAFNLIYSAVVIVILTLIF